jgi:Family of unknown function (DUF6495)
MKYRTLNDMEREAFREEFVNYLASNTITASDWVKLRKDKPEVAQELFERFSDIIFQKVYEKIDFLHVFGLDYAAFYGIQKNETVVYIIQVQSKSDQTNYTETEMIDQLSHHLEKCQINVYRKQLNDRELEIHGLVENGANSCDGTIFNQLQDQIRA